MFTLDELVQGINDPNSPMRQRLLHNLAMSPLDPATAMQMLQQSGGDVQAGGLPPPQKPPESGMQEMLGMTVKPDALVGSMGPNSFDYTAPNNGAPVGDVNNPNFVPPAMLAETGTNPMASIMPGATGGIPDSTGGMDYAMLKKMLEGAGGLDQKKAPINYPAPPPLVNNWRGFTAQQLQTPGATPHMSLGQILGSR